MRTKTLLLIAAVAAAAITACNAQVYSVNAVGYVNKTIPAKSFSMISNPLNAQNNSLDSLFAGQATDGDKLYMWNTTKKGYDISEYIDGVGWDPSGATTLTPGQGGFYYNNAAAAKTITFVGEVPQGKAPNSLTVALVPGFQIVSSKVPQAGTVEALGLVGTPGDKVYKWDTAKKGYVISEYIDNDIKWDPAVTIDVGEAFFLSKTAAGTWTRDFTVSP